MRKALLSSLLLLLAAGCSAPTAEEDPINKGDAMAGKADGLDLCGLLDFAPGCDLCAELGWYGDGECDAALINADICVGPDPDCGGQSVFGSFRLSQSGFCPPELDCSGSIELDSDGTLRLDRTGELPSVIHEATITTDELADVVEVLTAPELVDLLSASEPPCSPPTDIYEGMTLELADATHQNSTTFCRDDALVAVRDALSELTDRYFPRGVELGSFRIGMSGFCPPSVDCSGFIELSSDGTLRFDRTGELPSVTHEAVVTETELADAIAVLTQPALVALLDLSEAPCSTPTDIYEDMELIEPDGRSHRNSTTFCSDEPLADARAVLGALVDRYAPTSVFGSFRISGGGFCPPSVDCSSFIELHADGTLRVDRSGEIPTVVHEATVTASELADAVAVLTDPALVELLSLDEAPCVEPTDIHESMVLELDGETIRNSTTFCSQAPLVAARDALRSLAAAHTPMGTP